MSESELTETLPLSGTLNLEALCRLADEEHRALARLERADAARSAAEAAEQAKAVLARGRALQQFLLVDVPEAMPELPASSPVFVILMEAGNDFIRKGRLLAKAADARAAGESHL